MSEAASAEGPWEWSLGSWVDVDGERSLTLGRLVSDDELEEWQAAAQFLRTLASGSTYPRALEAIQQLNAQVQRLAEQPETERSPVDLDALQPAFAQVARLIVSAAEAVGSEIDNFPISHEEAAAARSAIGQHASTEALRNYKDIADTDEPVPVGLVADANGVRLVRGDTGEDAIALLHRAAFSIQLMHAERLAALEESVRDASTKLRLATAEVLDGAPLLIRHKPLGEGLPALGAVTFDDLALPRIAPLQRLIERARRALAARPEDGQAGRAVPEEAAQGRPTGEAPEPDGAETPAEQPDGPPVIDEGMTDLRSLIAQLTTTGTELEHAWSSALDAVLTDQALEATRAQWGSLLGALHRQAEVDAKHASDAGLDSLLSGELLQASPAAIELDPQPEQAWKQAEVASAYALKSLIEASRALISHPIEQWTVSEGQLETVRTLWESGAFAQVKAAGEFLADVHEERTAAERRASGGDVEARDGSEAFATAMGHVGRARQAYDRGDPEAAVVHLNAFFKALATTQIDADRLTAASPASQVVSRGAERIGRGEPFALSTATLCAVAGFAAAAQLLLPPEALQERPSPAVPTEEGQ